MLTALGIALPAVLLVLAVRRWIADVPWRIAALFLALTLLFLHGAVFTSKLPLPVDEVCRGYPWRGVVGEVQPRNPTTNDTVRLFLPWMQAAREEVLAFHAPLWNRYSFSGYPLLGNGESAPFSPLFLATLFVPLPKQIVAMAGLKLFVALLFGYLFLKRERASESAACFLAVAFAFSCLMTVYLYYSTSAVVAFLPAALFALLHVIDAPRKSSVVFLALVIATLMANGHPESVLHIAAGAACVLAIELALARDRRACLRRFPIVLGGVAAGLALSAPAWLPVAEMVPRSVRYAALHGAKAPSMPLTAAWAMVTPNGFGSPLRHNYSWFVNYANVVPSYAGLMVLALAAAALLSRHTATRERWRLGAAALLFLVAMNWTPIGHLANALPLLSVTANDKLRIVSLFLAAAVAAKAIGESRWRFAVAAVPLILLVAYVYHAKAALMRPADLAGVAALILYLLLPPRWQGAGAVALCAAELFVFNAGFNALVDARYDRPELPIVQALRARAPHEPFRVAGLDWCFLPDASGRYGLEDVRGSDPMELESYAEWMRPFTRRDSAADVDRVVDPNAPQLDAAGVRFLLTDPGVDLGGKWTRVYYGRDGGLYENGAARRRFWGADIQEISEVRPGRYRFRVWAVGVTRIESSLPLAPGWRVRVGGRTVDLRRGEGPFLAFDVPPGESEVMVEYAPRSYWLGVLVAAVTAVGLIFLRGRNREWGDAVMPGPDAVLVVEN